MRKKVLLDANLIISAFDSENLEALEQMNQLIIDDDIDLCVTPLIRYEVLRGVPFDDSDTYETLRLILDDFIELDIKRNTSELASNLFRYARFCEREIVNKRSFDVFHCTTAICNSCDIHSNDSDIKKISDLHAEYCDETSSSE